MNWIILVSIFLYATLVSIILARVSKSSSLIDLLNPKLADKIRLYKLLGEERIKVLESDPANATPEESIKLQSIMGIDPNEKSTHYLEIYISDGSVVKLNRKFFSFYENGESGCQQRAKEILHDGFYHPNLKTSYSANAIQKITIQEIKQ